MPDNRQDLDFNKASLSHHRTRSSTLRIFGDASAASHLPRHHGLWTLSTSSDRLSAMYWPIGSPRVYAEAQDIPQERAQVSHENAGAHRKAAVGGPAAKHGNGINDGQSEARQSPTSDQHSISANGDGTRRSSRTPGEKENLLGTRLARNGQLFVTWTASSFSIWQAKVSRNRYIEPYRVLTCRAIANGRSRTRPTIS